MNIDNATVNKIAGLAKLEFEAEAMEAIKTDLNNVVAFIEKLNELDTSGIEPLIFMSDEVNVLREDVTKQEITQQQALLNAPKHDSDYFKAPKVIGG